MLVVIISFSLTYICFYVAFNHKISCKLWLESLSNKVNCSCFKNRPRAALEQDTFYNPLARIYLPIGFPWQVSSCDCVWPRVWSESWLTFGDLALTLLKVLATWMLCFKDRRNFPLTAQKQSCGVRCSTFYIFQSRQRPTWLPKVLKLEHFFNLNFTQSSVVFYKYHVGPSQNSHIYSAGGFPTLSTSQWILVCELHSA